MLQSVMVADGHWLAK